MDQAEEIQQISKKVQNLVDSAKKKPELFAELVDNLIDIFDAAFEADAPLDPRRREGDDSNTNASSACKELFQVAYKLIRSDLSEDAFKLLMYGWNKFAQIQKDSPENGRIYRAGFAMYLSKLYWELRDTGASLRWALLAQADDALDNFHTGGARNHLRTRFGLKQELLDSLQQVSDENREAINGQWSSHRAFAEDIVLRLALREPEIASFLSRTTDQDEYPLDRTYFQALLNYVNSAPSKEKGAALEDLATYLFLLIPGWIPRRNVTDEYQTFENDIVIRNNRRQSDLTSDLFGRYFLVECKNWNKAVNVKHVGYFLYRMHLVHADFGVMFATNGITGMKRPQAARSIISKAFHEDRITCIVIENDDLIEIASGLSFWSLLTKKSEEMRFGKPKQKV